MTSHPSAPGGKVDAVVYAIVPVGNDPEANGVSQALRQFAFIPFIFHSILHTKCTKYFNALSKQ